MFAQLRKFFPTGTAAYLYKVNVDYLQLSHTYFADESPNTNQRSMRVANKSDSYNLPKTLRETNYKFPNKLNYKPETQQNDWTITRSRLLLISLQDRKGKLRYKLREGRRSGDNIYRQTWWINRDN